MARVVLPTSVARQFAAATEFEVAAANVRAMLEALDTQHPGLRREIEDTMALAIDGEIYQDYMLEPLQPESEVFVVPKIGGG
ncbi:MAG: MoaD/ThiS family protein [Alphaproteobacteria bacterium]